jgi:hypothetical protein
MRCTALIALALGAALALSVSRWLVPADGVLVLYSWRDSAAVQTACPTLGSCARRPIEALGCWARFPGRHPHTVILAGHSLPPDAYLGQAPGRVAALLACLEPQTVVLDTCYGASMPLLEALAATGAGPLIIGSTERLPPAGLIYDARLFSTASPPDPTALVRARSGRHLEVFRIDPAALAQARATVAAWDAPTLESHLRRKHPNLVTVGLPGGSASILVPVSPARFHSPYAPTHRVTSWTLALRGR